MLLLVLLIQLPRRRHGRRGVRKKRIACKLEAVIAMSDVIDVSAAAPEVTPAVSAMLPIRRT